jgi:hypothetical protein
VKRIGFGRFGSLVKKMMKMKMKMMKMFGNLKWQRR